MLYINFKSGHILLVSVHFIWTGNFTSILYIQWSLSNPAIIALD